jgi:hypothetical protein
VIWFIVVVAVLFVIAIALLAFELGRFEIKEEDVELDEQAAEERTRPLGNVNVLRDDDE